MVPAHTLAASRGLEDRKLQLVREKNMASAVIRKVNFNSNKVIAGEISINLNKGLDFSKFRFYSSAMIQQLIIWIEFMR